MSLFCTIKNSTEGREGHEGKNRRNPPGSNVGVLNPVLAIPPGARWAPPAAVIEPFRPLPSAGQASRPSVNVLDVGAGKA